MGLTIGNYIGIGKNSGKSYWLTRTPSGLTALTISDNQVDLSLTENGTGFDGYSWERSEDGGLNYTEFGTTLITDVDISDTTFSEPKILKYRARAYKGSQYSPYTDVVTVYPAGVRVNSANTDIILADATNEFYFNNAGQDQPFSVIAIAKSNSLVITNTLLSRGDVNGCSYNIRLNTANGRLDIVIYGSDLTNDNLLYAFTNEACQDNNVNRIIWTYSGNEAVTGINFYDYKAKIHKYEKQSG